jgi:YHS domain-containing protein
MKSISFVTASALALAMTALAASAQDSPTKPPEKPKANPEQKAPSSSEKVTVVFLGNSSCPQDSKAIDREKFVEVEGQRIYVCSDECAAALKKDAAAAKSALAKAYPTATPVASKECLCGEAVEAGKGTDVTFQGRKVALCSPDCASAFKKAPVTAIALIMSPGAKDAKNLTDPIDGKGIDATIVAIYRTHLVHFSSWANAASFEKDPTPVMAKLKLSG